MTDDALDAAEVVRLLAAPERLKVVAALVLGSSSTADVGAVTGLAQRVVLEALARLEAGGLVDRDGTEWVLRSDRLAEACVTAPVETAAYPGVAEGSAVVLQRFIRGGRLLSVPTQRAKRLVVLDHLAHMFEPGVHYTEREVSETLAAVYDDYAALRRYLVDEGFLSREAGTYWRSGGSVEL